MSILQRLDAIAISGRLGMVRGNHIGTCLLLVAFLTFPTSSMAVEGGGSNWAMGSTGFGAGLIPEPGFHYANLLWLMDIDTNQDFTLGTNRVDNLNVELTINFLLPAYTGEIKPWNARYKAIAVLPIVWIDGRYRVRAAPNEHESKQHNLGDPGLDLAIGWHKDDFLGKEGLSLDYAPGLFVVAPWGKYERQEVLNAGRYRWTIQPNFSYTLLYEPTGIELSQRTMYAINLKNDRTDYNSGDEFHLDWALGKRFGNGWQAGLFGFFYKQITADDGRGATLGDLKGKSWGIGPIIQYSREYWGTPVTAALRVQKVMQHRKRTDDDSIMFNFIMSF